MNFGRQLDYGRWAIKVFNKSLLLENKYCIIGFSQPQVTTQVFASHKLHRRIKFELCRRMVRP